MIKNNEIKKQFPFFAENPDLVYLDSAATSHKPESVINTINKFYRQDNANAGRSTYPLATKLDKKISEVREKVAQFINAKANEIFFTSGATEAFNRTAFLIGLNMLKDGDEVLYSPLDHSSFVDPWFEVQKILERMGIKINLIEYETKNTGGANIDNILEKITSKTKVLNITHIHNIFGSNSDIENLKVIENNNFIVNVDATQSIGHMKVDVNDLGADILSFSGHKMFAMQGIGATYISEKLHSELKPIFRGGGAKDNAVFSNTNFEVGTQNYAGILSLEAAIEFIEDVRIENIELHNSMLTTYLLEKLRELPKINFLYGPNNWNCAGGYGIISFTVDGLSSQDIGFVLAQNNILVRTGNHCSATEDKITDSVRVSMHIYNTREDIDIFIETLKKCL